MPYFDFHAGTQSRTSARRSIFASRTGVSFLLSDLGPKQLGLLRELVPHAKRIGLMVNPHNANIEASKTEVVLAASAIGVDLKVVEASDSREIETAATAPLSRCRWPG
jgi:ABC-type uncharacterized transport system substrate-binding protein